MFQWGCNQCKFTKDFANNVLSSGSAELVPVQRYRERIPWIFTCGSISISVLVAMFNNRLKFVRKSAHSIGFKMSLWAVN